MPYTKLFASLITSTIWTEDDQTRIVWITMLATSDKNGEVQASIPGLARVAGVTLEACERAIGKFLAPDQHSRTALCEGRRIEAIDGGWALINHAKYRDMASKEQSKAANAARQRRFKSKQGGNGKALPVTPGNALVTHDRDIADADADADAEVQPEERTGARGSLRSPTLAQTKAAASNIGVPEVVAEIWWNEMEGSGWVDGRNRPVRRWQNALASYGGKWRANESKNGKAPPPSSRPPGPPRAYQADSLI